MEIKALHFLQRHTYAEGIATATMYSMYALVNGIRPEQHILLWQSFCLSLRAAQDVTVVYGAVRIIKDLLQ